MLITAQVLKEKWFENDGFCSVTNNKLVNEAANDCSPGVEGKIVKYRPLSEPIRLQDLEDSPDRKLGKK